MKATTWIHSYNAKTLNLNLGISIRFGKFQIKGKILLDIEHKSTKSSIICLLCYITSLKLEGISQLRHRGHEFNDVEGV